MTHGMAKYLICRVLESLKAGKRLPEARFATLKVARERQQSVLASYAPAPEQPTQGGSET